MIVVLKLLSLLCALVFFSSIFIAHLLKPELDWVSQTLSMYALGEYGYIINTGFFCIGTTQCLLALTLFLTRPFNVRLAATLLFGAGLGVYLVAIFPTQAQPTGLLSQLPHIVGASMQFLLFPLAALVISRNLSAGKMKTWTSISAYTTAKLFIVIIILFIIKFTIDIPFFGIIEKIDILVINLWLISFAFYSTRHNSQIMFSR
jgi:hypothetical protein